MGTLTNAFKFRIFVFQTINYYCYYIFFYRGMAGFRGSKTYGLIDI